MILFWAHKSRPREGLGVRASVAVLARVAFPTLDSVAEVPRMNWGPEAWDAWTQQTLGVEDVAPPAEALALLDILEQLPDKKKMTAADLGCGTGTLLPFLAARFREVVAVDYAPASLAIARRTCPKGRVIFRRRDLRDLTPFRQSFHVAVAVESILGPRPRDVDRMLHEIHGSLVDGGVLLATVPARGRRGAPVMMPLGNLARFEGEVRFTETDLQYRLRKAGFAGVRLRRFAASATRPEMFLAMGVRRANN